jgi:hypothetical protein
MRPASREPSMTPTRGGAAVTTSEPGRAVAIEAAETDELRLAAAIRLEKYELERASEEGMDGAALSAASHGSRVA